MFRTNKHKKEPEQQGTPNTNEDQDSTTHPTPEKEAFLLPEPEATIGSLSPFTRCLFYFCPLTEASRS